jgi:hypothetical protein
MSIGLHRITSGSQSPCGLKRRIATSKPWRPSPGINSPFCLLVLCALQPAKDKPMKTNQTDILSALLPHAGLLWDRGLIDDETLNAAQAVEFPPSVGDFVRVEFPGDKLHGQTGTVMQSSGHLRLVVCAAWELWIPREKLLPASSPAGEVEAWELTDGRDTFTIRHVTLSEAAKLNDEARRSTDGGMWWAKCSAVPSPSSILGSLDAGMALSQAVLVAVVNASGGLVSCDVEWSAHPGSREVPAGWAVHVVPLSVALQAGAELEGGRGA